MSACETIFLIFIFTTVSYQKQDIAPSIINYLQKFSTCQNELLYTEVKEFESCFKSIGENISLKTEDSEVKQDDMIQFMCNLDLTKCHKELGKNIQNCSKELKYKELIESQVNFISVAQKFICSTSSKPSLKEFLINGIPCLKHPKVTKITLNECNQHFIQIRKELVEEFSFDTICRGINELSKCVLDALDLCEDKTAKNFIKNLLTESLKNTNCKFQYSNSSPSISKLNYFLFISPIFIQLFCT